MIQFTDLTNPEQEAAKAFASQQKAAGASYGVIAEKISERWNCSITKMGVWKWFNEAPKRKSTAKPKAVAGAIIAKLDETVTEVIAEMELLKSLNPAQRILYIADQQIMRRAMLSSLIDKMVLNGMIGIQNKEEVDQKLLYLLSSMGKNYYISPSEMLRIAEYAEQIGDTSDDPITVTATKEANTGQPKATT